MQDQLTASASEQNTIEEPFKIKVSSMALFDDRYSYINCSRMYYAYFESMPSLKVLRGFDYQKAMELIEQRYSDQIANKHYRQNFNSESKEMIYKDIIYILRNKILIDIDKEGDIAILFTTELEENAQAIVNDLKMVALKKNTSHDISILVDKGTGLGLIDLKNKKPKLKLELNYNDDLVLMHKNIVRDLVKRDNCGLVLFHGLPGTGKSTYIRYLIHCLNKKVIFLQPKLAKNLDSPELTNILVDNPKSVLVIEDAEDLLKSRETGNDSNISMLLNLTDGMLGESLGIQVICTFNSHLSNIDSALLRKGRLMALYEFKALCAPKAETLLTKLGVDYPVSGSMTLADIYNVRGQNFEFDTKRKTIGFAIKAA